MDPLSATATLLGTVDVALRTTSALVAYAQDTRNASGDRKLLAEETSSLLSILGRLRDRAESKTLDPRGLDEQRDIVRQFERACNDLAASLNIDTSTGQLKRESRLKAIRTAAKWSFSKSEVYSLLERVTRLQQFANTLLLNNQNLLLEGIDQMQQEAASKKLKAAILNWLSPLQMARVHQTISARAQEGSGRWFLTSKEFIEWQLGTEKLLWCSGIPGAGKTVIASIVVDHLLRERAQRKDSLSMGIAVVYLKYNDPEQTLNNVLGSLLKQLAQEYESIPETLQELYDGYNDPNTLPSLDEISAAILSLIETYEEVFFVLDALDECSDEIRWGLIEKLREFYPEVHLLITSRFRDTIDEELEDFKRFEIKANRADIELFIDQQIQKNKNLRRIVEKKPALRGDIKEEVVKTADEMFLLARLHVESLASAAALSIRHVRNKLQTLPTTLVGTYDEAMQRIAMQDSEHKSIALKALAWVSYSFRSLSLKELQHALAVEPGDTDLDEELVMDGHSITALCAGLVIIDLGTDAVNLVHYTTKKYFEDTRKVYFPGFHGSITMSCATYLTMPALQNATIWKIAQEYPLACYAAQYMADHARLNPEEALEPSVLEAIYQLLSQPNKRKPLLSLLDGLDLIRSGFYSSNEAPLPNFNDDVAEDVPSRSCAKLPIESTAEATVQDHESLAGQNLATTGDNTALDVSIETSDNLVIRLTEAKISGVKKGQNEVKTSQMLEVTALHLAASMGLAKVASMLLKETSNIDAVDETGKTALAVAIERGFEKAVEFLVNSGSRVDLRTDHGQGVLLLVTERDWHTVAGIVTQRARATAAKEDLHVSLLIAAYYGDEQEVRRLLEQETLELKSGDKKVGALALFLAVERNHPRMVQLLLSSGVDINSKDNIGQSSLHRATRRGSEVLMRTLLDNGADIEQKNDDGRTAWSANIFSKNEYILNILLEAGADPSTRGHNGVSEIYSAAANGNADLVRFMLKSGTNPSIRTNFDWAPLHWAAYHGRVECVKLLIDAGADLSPVSDQDKTPLDLAISANQVAVIDLLSRVGAKQQQDITLETSNLTVDDYEAKAECLVEVVETTTLPMTKDNRSHAKLSLTFDEPLNQSLTHGQFIYLPQDLTGEDNLIYQISHPLDTVTQSISVRHAKARPRMWEYPLRPDRFVRENVLYDIVPLTIDYQELKLRGNPDSPLAGTIIMRRIWTGSWKVHHEYEGKRVLLFRTTPDWSQDQNEGYRWATEDGQLLARTGGHEESKFRFEKTLDRKILDVLVTCWIAKIWSETLTVRKPSDSAS